MCAFGKFLNGIGCQGRGVLIWSGIPAMYEVGRVRCEILRECPLIRRLLLRGW
jgi:hypothetical protein